MAPTEQTQLLQRVTQLTAAGHPLPGELLEALSEWLDDQEDEAAALVHEQAMATGTAEVLDLAEVRQQRGWTSGGLR
jgi:hypothetical protein